MAKITVVYNDELDTWMIMELASYISLEVEEQLKNFINDDDDNNKVRHKMVCRTQFAKLKSISVKS